MSHRLSTSLTLALATWSLAAFADANATGGTAAVPKKDSKATILVRVNDKVITRGDLDRYSDMMVFLLRNRRNGKLTAKEAEKFKKKNLQRFSEMMMSRLVISEGLASSNVVETAHARETKVRECMRNYAHKRQTMPQLEAALKKAGYLEDFKSGLAFDIRLQSFVETVRSNEYFASEADLPVVKANLTRYNEIAAATNALNLAMARSVREKALAGDDFSKLADQYSQDSEKEPGGALGDCDETDFPEEATLWKTLSKAPEGFISEVVESDAGYVIYKVLRHNTAETSNTGTPSTSLARIYFRQAYLYPEQTDDELMADIAAEKRAKCMADVYKDFRSQVKVDYPDGHVGK